MLTAPADLTVYVATQPVDFRKGADGLALLAKETLGHDPMKGVAVVFRAKRADRVKIVVWDGSGLVMYWKRLDSGRLQMASRCGRRHADECGAVVCASGRHGLDTHARASKLAAESTCVENKNRRCIGARSMADSGSMSDLPDELPSDVAELRAFAAALLDRCAKLERLLKLAKDARFGRSSEKLDADQLQLVLEDIDEAVAALEAAEDRANPKTCEKRTAKRRANRGQLPKHLPRIVETLMPAETCCPCCEGVLFEIGSDESQRLDVVPAQYRVIVTRRPRLACRACHGVVLQHAAPERLIKGGLPTERLVAHVIDAKYHWHLPLYRQAQMLATHGIALDRSTLAFWVGYAAQELKPLWHRLREILLASAKLCVDETPAPVLDPGRGRTKTGYFWALSRDDRPWAGPEPPGVVYAYAPGRGAVHGLRLLEGYGGIIHCDGYEAYKTMTRATRADALSGTLAFCWSHLRRQFVKIEREAVPAPAPVAREALERIAQLYAIEKALRGRSAAERRAGRQAHARPLAAALKQWFEAKLDHLAQKSDTAKALRYALRHWDGLTLYLDDGRIEMDTNAVERAMRPIKLNAKNSLFAGCDEGAENWALLASLIETCKLNGVSAEHWLADVLAKLVNGWPASRLDELLPWASTYTMHAQDPRLVA